MNEIIKSKAKEIIKDISSHCIFAGFAINYTNSGFEITTKWDIPEDYESVYDKNGVELFVGDKVKMPVYYGETEGTVIAKYPFDKRIDVENTSGDIFCNETRFCEKIIDK